MKDYATYLKEKFPAKPGFVSRIEKLLGKAGASEFFEICYTPTPNSIRCNTLKVSVEDLLERFVGYGWDVRQPFSEFPEVMVVENKLLPGELGKTREHLLGYYYVQEISSMLPMMALKPGVDDIVLGLLLSRVNLRIIY